MAMPRARTGCGKFTPIKTLTSFDSHFPSPVAAGKVGLGSDGAALEHGAHLSALPPLPSLCTPRTKRRTLLLFLGQCHCQGCWAAQLVALGPVG